MSVRWVFRLPDRPLAEQSRLGILPSVRLRLAGRDARWPRIRGDGPLGEASHNASSRIALRPTARPSILIGGVYSTLM